MSKQHNKQRKSQQELHSYKNMVKYKTDIEDTDNHKTYIEDLQGTKETVDEEINLGRTKEEPKIQKPPLAFRAKEFFESYFTQLLIGALITLAGCIIGLQIGQAVQSNKIEIVEENEKETRKIIEDKYIRKDIYDIQLENLKDKIKNLEEEIKEMKNKN